MAREAKKDPNELTVEQKLKTLFQLHFRWKCKTLKMKLLV